MPKNVTVTQLPYIKPRKVRAHEPNRFVVKWIVEDTMYFREFKRDNAACDFLQKLDSVGITARVLMK